MKLQWIIICHPYRVFEFYGTNDAAWSYAETLKEQGYKVEYLMPKL